MKTLAAYRVIVWILLFCSLIQTSRAQTQASGSRENETSSAVNLQSPAPPPVQQAEDYSADYQIGRDDLLEISVLEFADLNRTVRVSAGGEISMPPLGVVKVAGMTTHEVEEHLVSLLKKDIMQDPHVSVFVREIESHPVSVAGAVRKPGVFRIRGPKRLLEVIAMAEGMADDAGDTVMVVRGAASSVEAAHRPQSESGEQQPAMASAQPQPAALPVSSSTTEVSVKDLMNSGESRFNVLVYPGDIVTVNRAGLVYVLGDVRKPGGFVLRNSDSISVLQALALAEGFTPTASKGQARIIRTAEGTQQRQEIPIDLGKVMAGKTEDPMLQPQDVVFVPKSGGKLAIFRSAEMILSTLPGALIYRGW
jgi:polysaccharide export outer membrane protein